MSPIEVQRRTPNAVAHYLRPARWVGTAPDWAHPNPQLDPQPAQLGELVVERDLPDSIRARAFRDGIVAFLLGDRAPSRGDDLPSWIYYGVRLMNAHLACLHAAADAPFTAAVVTPWSMMQVEFDSGNLTEMNPLDDLWTITLALARNPNTKSTDGVVDYRYFRPAPTVGVDALDRSFDLLASLLACDDRDAVLLRAELLARAKTAFVENDFSGALTNAWTGAEGMLGELLQAYLHENENRPSGTDENGNQLKFINEGRRKWLDGAEMTVRHTMEFLSLVDALPFDLYRDARRSSKVRNDWLHLEKQPTYDDAETAIRLAGRLFELREGIPLNVLGSDAQ